ncbi:hypothetical protein [Pseudomonas zeae]
MRTLILASVVAPVIDQGIPITGLLARLLIATSYCTSESARLCG